VTIIEIADRAGAAQWPAVALLLHTIWDAISGMF
jgi:hypothetical protein